MEFRSADRKKEKAISEDTRWLRPRDVAELLGLTPSAILKAVKMGRLRAHRPYPGVVLIDQADADAYRERGRGHSSADAQGVTADRAGDVGAAGESADDEGGPSEEGAPAATPRPPAPASTAGSAPMSSPPATRATPAPAAPADPPRAPRWLGTAEERRKAAEQLRESTRRIRERVEQENAARAHRRSAAPGSTEVGAAPPAPPADAPPAPRPEEEKAGRKDRKTRARESFGNRGY
jgi:hypothetical protein